MPRKKTKSLIRPIQPDRKYNSVLVQRLINRSMVDGKKASAEAAVYKAMEEAAKKEADQKEEEAEAKTEKKSTKKEKGFFDDPVVKSMTRTAGNTIVRTLLGVLGLGGRTRRKSLF